MHLPKTALKTWVGEKCTGLKKDYCYEEIKMLHEKIYTMQRKSPKRNREAKQTEDLEKM